MIENYENVTVDETLDAVSDWSDEDKSEFLAFEREHKNRTGVVEPLEEELADTDETVSVQNDDSGPETVEVTVEQYGYAAGLWFDSADETKTVERTTRIDRALDNDDLQLVE